MVITELLTAAIAIYGALLSTFTLVLHQREKKQKVTVKLWLGMLGVGKSSVVDIVIMEAANAGSVPIHLSNCCYLIPHSKKKLVARFEYDKEMPITLAPGESVQAWMKSEDFIATLKKEGYNNQVKVVAQFSNKAGREFLSKAEVWELDKLLYAKNNPG